MYTVIMTKVSQGVDVQRFYTFNIDGTAFAFSTCQLYPVGGSHMTMTGRDARRMIAFALLDGWELTCDSRDILNHRQDWEEEE